MWLSSAPLMMPGHAGSPSAGHMISLAPGPWVAPPMAERQWKSPKPKPAEQLLSACIIPVFGHLSEAWDVIQRPVAPANQNCGALPDQKMLFQTF